jgi:type II secretory pathway component GspD/PulD (secretin)
MQPQPWCLLTTDFERLEMKPNCDATQRWVSSIGISLGLTLTMTLFAGSAQAQPADSKTTESKPADVRPDEAKLSYGTYQTLYLTNLTQQGDANDIQTDLRNMLPMAKLYYVPSQSAISVRGTPEDIQLAQKIISDLDKVRKSYRLTYTMTETDGGKPVGTQHFAVVVMLGGKTVLKDGSRVPLVTGTARGESTAESSQVQYVDVGLNIDASLDGYLDGLRLRTKIEQSKVAEEKSSVGIQDPVIRQTTLEATSTLTPGKPVVLGSIDVPGSSRKQEIEVVSELVK